MKILPTHSIQQKLFQTKVFLVLLVTLFVGFFLFSSDSVSAQTPAQPKFTIIVNQVRGQECCSGGGLNELSHQIDTIKALKLPATFTVRYDVFSEPEYVKVLKASQKNSQDFEIGAFLEITPQLAKDSQVSYSGTDENWYEAEYAFLVGYTPEERVKLIDMYMARFKTTFGAYPTVTSAWMIDSVSLAHLRQKYGIKVHQITREQYGVDSYTLYGGPSHYPYIPSEKWALVPANVEKIKATSVSNPSIQMPVIIRQTITDSVWNYGDPTSSFTSQPNDYDRKQRGFEYFEKLFTQIHHQPTEPYTFAVVGLENSMAEKYQEEFKKQLEVIEKWRSKEANGPQKVVNATQFATWLAEQLEQHPDWQSVSAVGGNNMGSEASQAWTITTPEYRTRVRWDAGKLFITDLRLYSSEFEDPYLHTASTRHGHWIVPFVLDGSRYWKEASTNSLSTLSPDNIAGREKTWSGPTQILLTQGKNIPVVERQDGEITITQNDQVVARFSSESFQVVKASEFFVQNKLLDSFIKYVPEEKISWQSEGKDLWGFTFSKKENLLQLTPFVNETDLTTQREARYPFLFPELKKRSPDKDKSELVVSNRYAQAGRNPIRLVFYPRDSYNYSIEAAAKPEVQSKPEVAIITQEESHGANGMIFIDLKHNQPGKFDVNFSLDEIHKTETVYFAPDCKADKKYCLTHPVQAWWFVRNAIGDKYRQWDKERQDKQFTTVSN